MSAPPAPVPAAAAVRPADPASGPVLGIAMLVHETLHRAAQLARHWAGQGCAVVIHVDLRIRPAAFARFRDGLADLPQVRFCRRFRCEWGTWSLVEAGRAASHMLLDEFPGVGHVLLTSGSCLPLRPVRELVAWLQAHPGTDFIESVTTRDVTWTVDGLHLERFTLRFPFAWRRQRRLFDGFVTLQRRLGLRRELPAGLVPHLGSQWWCLTRVTLQTIRHDPRRAELDRYFRGVWIPDESYYQSLVRLHGCRVESRSLTLAKFDFQGKPHVFYDDHLRLLQRSNCFLARKIWPGAAGLYRAFLSEGGGNIPAAGGPGAGIAPPQPGRIDRVFALAHERRTRGRAGLVRQSRFPHPGHEGPRTAAPYAVLQGFDALYDGFDAWLSGLQGLTLHGHLFAPERVEFAGGETSFAGALPDLATRRDYNPQAFLRALIWNTRGGAQAFRFGPRDRQEIGPFLAADPNAHVAAIVGAWAVPLWRSGRDSGRPFAELRQDAAILQQAEAAQLARLRHPGVRARVRIWSLAEAVAASGEPLRLLLEEVLAALVATPQPPRPPGPLPQLVPLEGFGQFLQELRNRGMEPHIMGDFPIAPGSAHWPARPDAPAPAQRYRLRARSD